MEEMFSRQIAFIGKDNHKKLKKSKVTIVGLGGIGSFVSEMISRSGIGKITLIDRDWVEKSNLGREILYDADDVDKPKALVAKKKLNVKKAFVEDLNQETIDLLKDSDVVIDCTDNMDTRYLINEYCIKSGIPWIYSSAIRDECYSATFTGKPCFRCLYPKEPKSGSLETCDISGVLVPTLGFVASWVVLEALKILTDVAPSKKLLHFSLKDSQFDFLDFKTRKDCPVCVRKKYEKLNENKPVKRICRNSFQVNKEVNLKDLRKKLKTNEMDFDLDDVLIHINLGDKRITAFKNRSVISGVEDANEARNLFDKVIGS